jgi:aryl-alcohol dehydrogenase-like predicted oxidoreductase
VLSERIGVIVYWPMGSGLLTGAMTRERIAALPEDDWRKTGPEFSGTPAIAQSAASRDLALGWPASQG